MLHVGARVCVGVRPEGRVEPFGLVRWAARKEGGASLAKVRAGKVRGWGIGVRVIWAAGWGRRIRSWVGLGFVDLGMWDFWRVK